MKSISVAQAHRHQQLLVGYAVAKASYLALIVNTVVVPAGLVVLMFSLTGWAWSLLITLPVVAVIGVLLALVADGQTLAGAARFRKVVEQKKAVAESFAKIPPNERTADIQTMQKEDEKRFKPLMYWSIASIAFFGLVSSSAGTLFWHKMLESLPWWQAWLFSTLFSVLITGTMCASEVYKSENDELIGESIQSGDYTAIALKKDANDAAIQIMSGKYKTQVEELANTTEVVQLAISQHAEEVYDEILMGGTGRLQVRMRQERDSREYVAQQQAEKTATQLRLIHGGSEPVREVSTYERIEEYMEKNPGCLNKDIEAALNDIPGRTVRTYAAQVRKKKQAS